jgi:hypothetical protein
MTFPSDFDGTCAWCGKVLPETRRVFCDDDCQGRYNRAADRYYEARHNPVEPETAHVAGMAIPGSGGRVDWFEQAASLARAHAALSGVDLPVPGRGVKP